MARTIEEAKKSGRKICRAIPLFLFYFFSRGKEVNGGESGIRTHVELPLTTFPMWRLRPLDHLSE